MSAPAAAGEVDRLRLAVIGDTQHFRDGEGRLCALEPVVLQLDRWAELFAEVVLCAPLDDGPPPKGYAPYRATNLRIEPLPRGGGNTMAAKLGMLRLLPVWAWRTRRLARSVDAVHLRSPCNITAVALVSTWRASRHRYGMYAGVWRGYAGEPRFFAFQRRLLASRSFGGPVSVYAAADPDRPHLEPSFSPSFSDADWLAAGPRADAKVAALRARPADGPWTLATVGRLTPNKNQQAAVRATARLVSAGHDARLEVYGDGPSRGALEALAAELGIAERVAFHGNVGHGDVLEALAAADVQILATRQEGFGKVLIEGMLHATVPVFAASPMADDIAGGGSRGRVFEADDDAALADHVASLIGDPSQLADLAADARTYARTVTLDCFSARIREVLERHWQVRLPAGGST
jgi:glycosyltransferase involved in cell wall biosynthesis